MALPKAVRYLIVLLVVYYSLENLGYRQSLTEFFGELMGTKEPHIHSREKRQAVANPSDYVIQAVVKTSELDLLRSILSSLSLPLEINATVQITSINTTTVCSPVLTNYQCRCEGSFAWSSDICSNYGACDNITGDTCGCVNSLPPNDQYCQPIATPPVTTPSTPPTTTSTTLTPSSPPPTTSTTPTPPTPPPAPSTPPPAPSTPPPTPSTPPPTPSATPPNDFFDTDLVLDLRIPVSSVPSSFLQIFRDYVNNYPFPYEITLSLKVTSLNLTTACYPNSMGGVQCQCEEQFTWSCDKCNIYNACGNATARPCGCINGLPSDGEFCEPITSIASCSSPIPVTTTALPNTTAAMPNTTAAMPNTTAAMPNTTAAMPNTTAAMPNTTAAMPNTTTAVPSTTTAMPNTTAAMPNTTAAMPNTTTAVPSTTTAMPNTTAAMPSTTTAMPNTTAAMPNTTTAVPSTTTAAMPNTTAAMPNTTTAMPNTTAAMPNTTTAVPSTTTAVPNTTTAVPSTTAAVPNTTTMPATPTTTVPTTTTTTTVPATTTTTTTVSTTPIGMDLSLAMDIDFDSKYNDPSSEVYQDVSKAIQEQCQKHIPTLQSVKITTFRSGSTIADYTITASAFREDQIKAAETGIFTDLGQKYPMIFDSTTPLMFQQPFFGESATVTCGPVPANLNFSNILTAEWTRDGKLILQDSEHKFSETKDTATLTVLRFFITDNGNYECKLKEKYIFRQKSNGRISFKEKPSIQVTPLSKTVLCEVGKTVSLQCSVNEPYKVEFKDTSAGRGETINYVYQITDCTNKEVKFTCQAVNFTQYKEEITLELLEPTARLVCLENSVYGGGNANDQVVVSCKSNEEGEKTAVCRETGEWEIIEDNCVLRPIKELLDQSEFLNANTLPGFLVQLRNVTLTFTAEVAQSPANINATVVILNNVANVASSAHIPIGQTSMEDILLTAGSLTTDGAKGSWDTLNSNSTTNGLATRSVAPKPERVSSLFLLSLETVTSNLNNESFNIETPSILLNKTTFTDSFNANFNSSVEIDIPEADGGSKSITVMTFSSIDNVLPARDENNSTLTVINGRVVLVQSSGTVNNISFTFDIINNTLENPQCVFWNFSLFDGLGGWDNEGCELIFNVNETVTCNCNHLTSFSILMSPYSPDDPVLDYITYIGVGISMASLVICLIIEGVIWGKIRKNNTSYLRHVSIVNIAVSLLIANIWFIIGAAISDPKMKNPPACTAATFFIHFFYLALFFWMLASALLLLYRTVSVFDGGLSKKSMLAIGFSLGYGAPLIIAIITIAVTAPKDEYTRGTGVCWLNWYESKALLAFVIPALVIVLINLIILFVVIYKMLRRRAVVDAAQAAERHVLVVIARSLAVLTPFFGLTWGLGVGTMTSPYNRGIHISFAFFNSLQGFFILVFGTLLDKKVRSEIAIQSQTSSGTRSTSAGTSSTSGLGFLRNWRRGRDGYNMSSNESGASHSFVNT
ncbi:adhesion G protein-coupled receptor F5-like isoform X2 [Toxotes jaculatrix]|uniref:adhesion G protein-coupled receptor F5-like isoform X2 n=1 Tax=Toxotes jaculatrix TaxID=941984 RepID=UPI001B3AAF3A|nr:adhesion G protein-coupled receptor F5-like isoform X2 [Toxotes jaculatrix]